MTTIKITDESQTAFGATVKDYLANSTNIYFANSIEDLL